uniref:Uncharacterized protein n=1 Tax=Candidatus Caldatribacterium saccharofermentans TaxID=1454753 RepID=A0A7V4TEM9_9BACT
METEERKKQKAKVLKYLNRYTPFATLIFIVLLDSYLYFWPGRVEPLKPSGYSVIREIDPFPSDHLVLPIEWNNTGARRVVVRQPELILYELDSSGRENGNVYRFPVAGEYPDVSHESFAKLYTIKQAFVLEPRSITTKVLVFHIEKWWDESNPRTYRFRFTKRERFNVYISFKTGLKEQPRVKLLEMDMPPTVDRLDRNSSEGYWWDFWPTVG